MGFTGASLELLIQDFNNRNVRPQGKLLTLSRYNVETAAQHFANIQTTCHWIMETKHGADKFNDKELFIALGFDSIDSMDYSPYEDADIIFDLNSESVPVDLIDRYDYILDGGTLEHVFHLPNALRNIHQMLKPGGTFIFDLPAFFEINHGFYNFSPCLFYDYFKVNKYVINKIVLYYEKDCMINKELPITDDIRVKTYDAVSGNHATIWGSVIKTDESTSGAIPSQSFYLQEWEFTSRGKEKLIKILEDSIEKAVFLYGNGIKAKMLLGLVPEVMSGKIAGIITSNKHEWGTMSYLGYNIFNINSVPVNSSIVIASTDYEDEIYESIKHYENKGIKIYKVFNVSELS